MSLHVVYILIIILLLQCSTLAVRLDLKDYMLAGMIATGTTDLLLYPIDTVKVVQQSNTARQPILKTLTQIYESGNKTAGRFFKGAAGYASLDGFSAAIFFAVYEEMKHETGKTLTGVALGLSCYLSAAVAFVASTIFLVPAEYVKTRMQTSSKYKTSIDCVKDCTEKDGWRGLYSGYSAIWIRDMPYFVLQLGCYDNIKNILRTAAAATIAQNFGIKLDSNSIELISSLAAGCITGFLTNPMDIITTRVITHSSNENKGQKPYKNLADCVSHMYQEEGLQVFFVGSVARVAWIAPFTAISLGLNERLKRHFLDSKALKTVSKPLFGGMGRGLYMNMMRKINPPKGTTL